MTNPNGTLVVKDGWLEPLVTSLRSQGIRVLAPVQEEGAVDLQEIEAIAQSTADYVNTRLPLKAVLFPRTEVILEYDKTPGEQIEVQPRRQKARPTVVLGVRPCDLSGVLVLDALFGGDYQDALYKRRREQTTLVGVACTDSDSACFCDAVEVGAGNSAGSDVFVRPLAAGGALLEVHTERGERLAAMIENATPPTGAEELAPLAVTSAAFDVDKVKAWVETHFEDEFWADMSRRCLGCGACSYLCPGCHCFDIVDEADWRGGQRRRNWDCCSFAQFTLHASGHNPRPDQSSRCRNRIMHKFSYFVDRFGRRSCVGCGRCARVCGAGQNLVRVLSEISAAES